jgi:DNA-binding IclR family transcriptional regulator
MAGQPTVEALSRGLSILRCFSTATEALGTSELARMTALPQPTVWRLCRTLEKDGYLVADGIDGRFRPGLAVLRLGFAALDLTDLPALLGPHLQGLAARFCLAASVAAREGLSMVFVHRRSAQASLTVNLRVGSILPIIASSTGWAYVAGLSEAEQKATIALIRREQPDLWSRHEHDFMAALAEYADCGFVVCDGAIRPDLRTVAVPLRHPETGVCYALSCSSLLHGVSTDSMRTLVGPALLDIASQFPQRAGEKCSTRSNPKLRHRARQLPPES